LAPAGIKPGPDGSLSVAAGLIHLTTPG